MPLMYTDEFYDWLLTQHSLRIIEAIKHPSPENDDLVRSMSLINPAWRDKVMQRIRELTQLIN